MRETHLEAHARGDSGERSGVSEKHAEMGHEEATVRRTTAFFVHGELRRELFTTLQKGMPKIAHVIDLRGIDGGDDIPILKPGLGRRFERFHLRGQGPRGPRTD